jgi:hypothetical protein
MQLEKGMRSHKTYFVCLMVILLSLSNMGNARGERRMKVGFMLDFVQGVSIPIANNDYKNFADVSYKLGVRIGVVLYLSRYFGFAPEAEFDFIPVNSSDHTFQDNGLDAQFYRERGLFGGRFIVPFGIGSFYARTLFGVDHIGGTVSVIPSEQPATHYSSTGFTFEPGAGVQFNVVKHLVVGFATGFPIALHNFNPNNSRSSFTAVDVDFLAVIGLRL